MERVNKFFMNLLTACVCIFVVCTGAYAEGCNTNQIPLSDGGCMDSKFNITTVDLTENTGMVFKFNISAKGNFFVDCGTDGVLSSNAATNDVFDGNNIIRNDTTNVLYECNYSTGGPKIIKFAGNATGYNINNVAAINFYNGATPGLLFSIDGALASIFRTLGTSNWQTPVFGGTFQNCVNLMSVSGNLFDGITRASNYMFVNTFNGCQNLQSIPSGFFDGVVGNAASLFSSTFYNCKSLQSIPADLFDSVSGSNQNMFDSTFYGCESLETIPPGLFKNISGKAKNLFNNTFYGCKSLQSIPDELFIGVSGAEGNLFSGTFQNCSNLRYIPSDLFYNVTGSANYMFSGTFSGCTNLEEIPAGLFRGVSGGSHGLFLNTFNNCKNLESIPVDLFAGVNRGADWMFSATFSGCSKLTGYIQPSMFAGLIANDSPIGTNMWLNTFLGTKLDKSCQTGTVQYNTGYETLWGYVACVDYGEQVCAGGQYLPRYSDTCQTCLTDSYCAGGTFSFNETYDQGIEACPDGLKSPLGMQSVEQCGRKMHINGDVLYLHSEKKTNPSLSVRIDNEVFYGNMTTENVRMNSETERKFKVNFNNIAYSVYDDSVSIN